MFSEVAKIAQVMLQYSCLGSRCQRILLTKLGKFLLLNIVYMHQEAMCLHASVSVETILHTQIYVLNIFYRSEESN